jgi:hypothetical protein
MKSGKIAVSRGTSFYLEVAGVAEPKNHYGLGTNADTDRVDEKTPSNWLPAENCPSGSQ